MNKKAYKLMFNQRTVSIDHFNACILTWTAEAAEPTIPTRLPEISASWFHSVEWKLSPDWSKARMKASDWLSLTSEVLTTLNIREDGLVERARGGEEEPALYCAPIGHHLGK